MYQDFFLTENDSSPLQWLIHTFLNPGKKRKWKVFQIRIEKQFSCFDFSLGGSFSSNLWLWQKITKIKFHSPNQRRSVQWSLTYGYFNSKRFSRLCFSQSELVVHWVSSSRSRRRKPKITKFVKASFYDEWTKGFYWLWGFTDNFLWSLRLYLRENKCCKFEFLNVHINCYKKMLWRQWHCCPVWSSSPILKSTFLLNTVTLNFIEWTRQFIIRRAKKPNQIPPKLIFIHVFN